MRTRNSETPKSAASKKTPPLKKDSPTAATPKSAAKQTPKTTRSAGKKPTPKSSKVEEMITPTEKKESLTASGKSPNPEEEAKMEETKNEVTPTKAEETNKKDGVLEVESAPESKSEAPATNAEEIGVFETESVPDSKSEGINMKEVVLEVESVADSKSEAPATNAEEIDMVEVTLEIDSVADSKSEDPATKADEIDMKESVLEIESLPDTMEEPEDEEVVDKEEEIEDDAKLKGVFEEPSNVELANEEAEEGEGKEAAELANEVVERGEGEEAAPEGDEAEGEEAAPEGDEAEEEEAARVAEEEQIEISDMAKARKIKKEQEIFVGGLDRDAVEEDLKAVFEKVGEVVEVRLHKDFTTNKNKGFAFVKFASKEQAAKALADLKSPVIRGKRCGIAPSEDNDTLFIGNICNTWTKEAIRRKLKDYGIDHVQGITLVADTQNEGLSRGFSFVEFSCHADAMLAYKRLQKPDAIFGHPERTVKVAFAEPLREPDPEIMSQVKSVFVDGLPPYWDEDRVKEHFKGYGEIERVMLARNMPTSRRKDFGFVNFTTHEAAVTCIEGVNDTELGDGKSKMKARARLANPLPKTQAVKGGMSGGFRIGYNGIGVHGRFGRGIGRGRYLPNRAGFHGGRGFHLRGRGIGGRFSFHADNAESSHPEFRTRRPFGVRGGGRGLAPARGGSFERGRSMAFPPPRRPYAPEEDYDLPFNARYPGEDPYFYGDGGHGMKRTFSMMEYDSGYLESGSRLRPRYDHPDSMPGGYRGSFGTGGLYSHNYYGSDYGRSPYSSLYRDERSGRGYYY